MIIINFTISALPEKNSNDNYDQTIGAIINCYEAGLPILRNALAGDLFWAALLFGVYDFSRARLRKARTS